MSEEIIHRRAYALEMSKTVDFLFHRVEKVYTVMGMRIPAKSDLDLMVKEFALDIRKRFSQFSLFEIAEALELGARGEYADTNYPSIAAFNKWLKSYKESGKHDEYVTCRREESRLMLPEKTEPTDGERLQSSINHCLSCFDNYRKTGKIIDWGNPAFDFLYQNRFLRLKQGEKELFIEDARTEMLRELSSRRVLGVAEKRDIKKAMDELVSGNEDSEAIIKSRAKQNLLIRYFDELLNNEEELSDILKQ